MIYDTEVSQAVPLRSGLSVNVQEVISEGQIDVAQHCVLWIFAMKECLCARSAYNVTSSDRSSYSIGELYGPVFHSVS